MLERRKVKVDLCVVGGGMAGVGAAVAAGGEGSQDAEHQGLGNPFFHGH